MKLTITSWDDGAPIPPRFAFGQIPAEGRFELGGNVSPALSWTDPPEGTQSFALICHDPDVPSVGDDVNQEGRSVPADLARVDFYHWVLVNMPADLRALDEGAASQGVTAGGKPPGPRSYGLAGINSYTDWFAGDADMGGDYGDYDGPCPPWNDTIVHHYHVTLYALSVPAVDVPAGFGGAEALAAIAPHVLARSAHVGTYTMNRDMAG